MRLSEIRNLTGGRMDGADPDLTGVTNDSRAVRPGDLFVAIRGAASDGHAYLAQAAAAGAAAFLVSDAAGAPAGVPRIVVPDTYAASVALAAPFYGHPARELTMIGVTGTSGKTTTTYLLESILKAAGHLPGVIGTVEYRFAGRILPAPNTSPDPLHLQRLLREMRSAGCTHCVMEVSSHAVALRRIEGAPFDAVAFTNLSVEHTDFHPTMEDYFLTKARLFAADPAKPGKRGATNLDDEYGARLAGLAAVPTVGFSLEGRGGLNARAAVFARDGAEFTLDGDGFAAARVKLALRGRFNVMNALAAAAAARAVGVPPDAIVRGLAALRNVPGRFERVPSDAPFDVIVDYAHKPDGLVKLLDAARLETGGRLLTVFGCGGDRSREKRPLMGRVAGERSDFTVVTSDNPRTEEPRAIIDEILPGLRAVTDRFVVEPDRRAAIGRAIGMAAPGDLVLIAGKGHEDYQIIGRTKHPFDDREVARELLDERRRREQASGDRPGFFY